MATSNSTPIYTTLTDATCTSCQGAEDRATNYAAMSDEHHSEKLENCACGKKSHIAQNMSIFLPFGDFKDAI